MDAISTTETLFVCELAPGAALARDWVLSCLLLSDGLNFALNIQFKEPPFLLADGGGARLGDLGLASDVASRSNWSLPMSFPASAEGGGT